jgi:hypothetical protein
MKYLDIDPIFFRDELTNKFRSPHLWGKNVQGDWQLRHNVWGGGLNDV